MFSRATDQLSPTRTLSLSGATVWPCAIKTFDMTPDGGDNWSVALENTGQSEIFFQDLVVGPGGRTGWHTHPGFLLITVKDGNVDWYDQDCSKRRFSAGQSFTESEHPHNVLNPGSENARLLIVYIVKKGDPRRIESPQPTCGAKLGLE